MEKPETQQPFLYYIKLSVLVLIIAFYLYLPGVQNFVTSGIFYLHHRDFDGLRLFILSYGIWAPVTSVALMTLQSIVPLVPGLIITLTNAWIFGWKFGALYSWAGALLGATLDFGVARWYGRPVVEHFLNIKYLKYLDWMDTFFKRHGVLTIFITRLTPVVPFKVISYGAGLTAISLPQFSIATAVGQTPAIVLYSILGQNLTHNVFSLITVTSLLIIAGAVAFYYRKTIERYLLSNKGGK
ncbi:MAG TPA: TVP38/TMEM64 family protein [Methylomusa anaerophila]|uniref:TVP38/TMEM64 family membrane protein n=1 Tax=Methylomusa anaerophila TaxID=1930071 RepID=A0A348APL4_9FIRM|nr:TVP38/TMEM64 family protein [Methylomusa anaerophila]BBB93012.1 TVP38/TMEM64 family inner membrane protein YdjZ [Methylomusa anaerophila]HML87155.1 TVP38/TMEM64 family protein [Methylomusa anaerophila]